MPTHHDQDSAKNPASLKPTQDRPHEQELGEQEHSSAGHPGVKDPNDIPDGSGSTRPAGSEQGKEDSGQSFDAG